MAEPRPAMRPLDGFVPLHWGAEITEVPELFALAQAWVVAISQAHLSTGFQYLVAKAWNPQWLNMDKSPDELVQALVGTDMYSGGHDPSFVDGRIIAGHYFSIRGTIYIVALCGVFRRLPLSQASDLLSKVALDVELPLPPVQSGDLSVTVFSDPRDIDNGVLVEFFRPHGIQVTHTEVSNNAAEDTVEQLIRVIVPWTALYAFLGGVYAGKVLARLGEAPGRQVLAFGTKLSDVLIGIARKTAAWRRPVTTIETLVSDCHLVFRFQKIPNGPLPKAMIDDLRRAVEEASRLVAHGRRAGWSLKKVIYRFSIITKKWELSGILRNDWSLITGDVARSLVDLINQPTSPGLEMPRQSANSTVLLITAVSSERSALLQILQDEYSKTPSRRELDGRYFNVFQWAGRKGLWEVYIGQPTEKGGPATQALLQDFVRAKSPALVLMVGMCGGLPENGAKEGMVVVAREVFNYEPARLRADGPAWSPTGYRCAARLLDLANSLGAEHAFGTIDVKSTKDYASGDKLIDDLRSDLRKKILGMSGDIIAFEMEGVDLLHAVWELERIGHIPVAIIKGVSDFGDGNQRDDKDLRQHRATQNASRVALKMLSEY